MEGHESSLAPVGRDLEPKSLIYGAHAVACSRMRATPGTARSAELMNVDIFKREASGNLKPWPAQTLTQLRS